MRAEWAAALQESNKHAMHHPIDWTRELNREARAVVSN